MDKEIFTEAELQAKKYGELLKIAKNVGAQYTSDTGRRLKTSKLIEVILEAQAVESIAENASNVISAINESASSKDLFQEEEPVASEELISDIKFPEDLEDEVASVIPNSKPEEECIDSEPPYTEPKTTRKRKGTFDVEESSENVSTHGRKSGNHQRTGTYEVTEEDKLEDTTPPAKRRRTATFEVNSTSESNDSASKSASNNKVQTGTYEVTEEDKMADPTPAAKCRRTSTFEINSTGESNNSASERDSKDKVQENSHQLEALRNDISSDKQVSAGSPSLEENESVGKLSLRSRSIVIKSKTRYSAMPKPMEEDKLAPAPTSETPKLSSTGKRQSIKSTDSSSVQKSRILPENLATRTPRFTRKFLAAPAKSVTKTPTNSIKSEMVSLNLSKRTPNLSRKSGVAAAKVVVGTPSSSRKSGLVSGMLAVATPSNFRKSVLTSGKLPNGTPKTEGKDQETSKIMKPLFNVGRGDAPAKSGKESRLPGSGIPRFVSFARKIRVPNFAKIHEKAFNRMEALDDYIDKKKKTLDNPDSASKKPRPRHASGEVFKPSVTSVENLNLNFAGNSTKSGKTPLKNSPKFKPGAMKSPKSCQKIMQETKSAKKSPNSVTKTKNSRLKSPKHLKSPKVISKKSLNASAHCNKLPSSLRKSSSVLKGSPKAHHSNIPKPHKENVKPGLVSFVSPAPVKVAGVAHPAISPGKESNPKSHIKKPVTYVPHKGALKPMNTAEAHKTMSVKIPPVRTIKDRREHQNKILKGVRFNKRFELQMAKRGIDITQ